MSTYSVDKDVPVPAQTQGLKYPWDKMNAGDSVLIPWEEERSNRYLQANVYAAAKQWLGRHRPDMACTTRSETDGLRVWFMHIAKVAEGSAG